MSLFLSCKTSLIVLRFHLLLVVQEIITLDSGKKLAKFSLATNEHYKDKDGQKQTKTDWHNIVAWNKTAELIEQYVSKGKEIAIEGKLSTRSYEDKEGQKRYTTEVVVNELLML